MSRIQPPPPLVIRTVNAGLYEGFNPIVAAIAKALAMAIVLLLITFPQGSSDAIAAVRQHSLSWFAAWYVYLLAAFVVFCVALVFTPKAGRMKLGSDNAIPEHSTQSWLAMMFCAGIGVGVLVFSVSEPMSHYLANPDLMNGRVSSDSIDTVASSLRFTYLHWGFSAWACYAVIGLALGLACHRLGNPLTMRSALAPLFGKRLEGTLGHAIDVIAILAIIAGITTTIVLGLEQIISGLSILTGSHFFSDNAGNAPLTALLTALVIAIAIAIGSITSGIERGVKWTSHLGIALSFGLLMVFITFGGGTRVIGLFWSAASTYLRDLPGLMSTVYDGNVASEAAQSNWQGTWTIFYWAWWIAFAPFVGLFLARISKGRTVREFILGAMLGPTAMCFIWFAGTGGSALLLELEGGANGVIADAEHAFRIYAAVDFMLSPTTATVTKAVISLLFLVLIVASSTAAILAIKSIGAAGSDRSETSFHSLSWAVVIASVAGAVMTVGGVSAIRDFMIAGAVPFSGIMAFMLISTCKMLRDDAQN